MRIKMADNIITFNGKNLIKVSLKTIVIWGIISMLLFTSAIVSKYLSLNVVMWAMFTLFNISAVLLIIVAFSYHGGNKV